MADFDAWLNSLELDTPAARHIDDDADGSFDCVDVAEDWAKYCFPGVSVNALLGSGDAKDLYAAASEQYFDKLPANIASLPGDIPVWGATATNAYGHIAVTINDDGTNLTDVEQNTYTQEAATIAHRSHNNIIGFLRPKVSQGDDMVTDIDILQSLFQRYRERNASDAEVTQFLNKASYHDLITLLADGDEAQQAFQDMSVGHVARRDDWQGQINSLKAQQANAGEANALGQALITLLTKFGYKKAV